MFTGFEQSVVIFAVTATYYIMDALMFSRYDRNREQDGTGKAWGYTIAMIILALFLTAQPVLLPVLGISTSEWWGCIFQMIGIILVLSGMTLHMWAREHLQHFYTERVEFQTGHIVVDTGPYALVRHPTFASFIQITLGLLLVNPALPTLLVFIYAVWDFTRAAKQEEELLSAKLPGYEEYAARTPRFIPRLRK
jgi:protein-S-isoprenylcysteine O-methyltransferase Ste14